MAECVMMVTYLSNILSTESTIKSPFELLYGVKPTLPESLKVFGEVGVVTTKDNIQAKLTNQGTTCVFMGYTENHSGDVYRMLNLSINTIILSHDIIWLKIMYKDWIQSKQSTIYDEDESEIELPTGVKRMKIIDSLMTLLM
jgi:hypothetical protein